MKKIIKYTIKLVLFCGIPLLCSRCHEVTVGYLETENAIYAPDSMVVKSILDTAEDAKRIKFTIPWQSTSIEGVQGTMPIRYSIRQIEGENIRPDITEQFRMIRKGVIELPWNHTVPPGRYVISIRIANEGYTHDLDSVYTVIVK